MYLLIVEDCTKCNSLILIEQIRKMELLRGKVLICFTLNICSSIDEYLNY